MPSDEGQQIYAVLAAYCKLCYIQHVDPNIPPIKSLQQPPPELKYCYKCQLPTRSGLFALTLLK